jgi:hypothetical protein
VAVGDVMDDLADCPATFAVGGVELSVVEAGNGGAEARGELAQGLNVRSTNGGSVFSGRTEFSDGITRIVKIAHGKNLKWRGGGPTRREKNADQASESRGLPQMSGNGLFRVAVGMMLLDGVGFVFGGVVAVVGVLMMLAGVLRSK